MPITMRPDAVRAGWVYAHNAAAELHGARGRRSDAAGHAMADLSSCLSDAASDMDGVLEVVLGVIAEHGTNVEDCITDFEATDGNSAGEFHGLSR